MSKNAFPITKMHFMFVYKGKMNFPDSKKSSMLWRTEKTLPNPLKTNENRMFFWCAQTCSLGAMRNSNFGKWYFFGHMKLELAFCFREQISPHPSLSRWWFFLKKYFFKEPPNCTPDPQANSQKHWFLQCQPHMCYLLTLLQEYWWFL